MTRIMPALEFVLRNNRSSVSAEVWTHATSCTIVPVQPLLSSGKPIHILKLILCSVISRLESACLRTVLSWVYLLEP